MTFGRKSIAIGIAAVALAFVRQSRADEASEHLLLTLKRLYPSTPIESVTETPVHGIYEFTMAKKIAYTDLSGRYVIIGSLFDMQMHQDLSSSRRIALEHIDTARLPLGDAFKHTVGSGKKVVYLFSDPDCPYCKTVQYELEKIDNLTIYVFEYPLTSIHPDAEQKAITIWCEKDDFSKWILWRQVLLEKKDAPKKQCQNPMARNIELGESLGIQGTPTLVSADGRRLPGMADSAKIEQWLVGAQK